MKDKFQSKAVLRGTRTIWRYLSALFILFTFAIGNVWAYTYNHATSVPEWTVNFNSWNGESDASGATAETVHNPRLYWNGSSYKNNLGTAQDIAFDGGGFYYIYEPNEARQLPTGSALSALSYVVAKAQGSYFKYNNTSSTVTSPVSTINGLTTNSSQTADVTYEFHMPRAGYVRLLIGTDSNGDPTGTANDAWKNVTLSGATTGDVAVTYHANGSTYDVKTKTGATTFSTVTYTSAGKKMRSVEFALNSGTTTMTTNPAKLSNNSGTARKMFIYAVEVYLESAATYTVTYKAGDGTGSDVVDDAATKVADCPATFSYTGHDFAGWKDALNNDVAVGATVTSDMTLTAQWVEHVAKYTVKYMDGTTELGSETVNVGSTPAGLASDPTKDCYTFAAWSPALSSVSGSDGDEVEVSATWTPVYSSSATLISDDVKDNKPNVNTVFAASHIVSSITFVEGNYEFTSNETKKGYYGYKDKNSGDYMKILVQQGKRAQVLFGNLGADPTINVNGVAKSLDAARATGDNVENTFTWTASAEDALISITMGSGTNTLKKVDIVQLYTATRVDAKSDGGGSDANVIETILPTPTAISGWTFTGWTANEDVKDSEDATKTAGTVLAAGTYTLLANTTFTAQWAEATSTYDITYVSDHGTAPADDNAASVVLAELSEEGWAHKGWTADVDVTVDAATVEAGTLIANGKTAILASDVTFTAVWKEVFTVTFDSKDGSAVDPIDVEDGATLAAAPSAPTKDNYVFQGWSESDGGAVVADITAITISGDKTFYAIWALDVQVSEIVFSNGFKAWINGSNIEVFYMAGESAPTIVSYDGKNLKAEGGVVISGDKIIATGTDDSEKEYDLTMTAVTPLTATGAQSFDGSETYVKTRHAWTAERKWKMSKHATDGRVARGECSMYFFFGPAENVTFTWGAQKVTEDVAVYVNGTFVKNIGKNNNSAIPLSGGNNMVAFYSLQTSGDIWVTDLNLKAYVPTTGVALQEGDDPISAKTIWESTKFTLTAVVTPDEASDKTITWTTSNDAVATVVDGVVTGVAANATPVTITATTVDGIYATCEVTVTAAPEPSAAPVITAQPASASYYEGATIAALEVVATGESLSYQWYLGADAIDGAIAATYTPTVSAIGSYVYHCVVTNTEAGHLPTSLASNDATITIADDPAAIKLIVAGAINKTNFTTGVTMDDDPITIATDDYDCASFGSTGGSIVGLTGLNKVVAYNATTTQTRVKFILYNTNSSPKELYLQKVLEGATEAVTETISVPSKELYETQYYTYNSSDLRSFYVTVNSTNIKILQVKVIENGTVLKRAGEAGYELNLNQGRVFGAQNTATTFEGLAFSPSSNAKVLNSTELPITTPLSFTIAAPVTLALTTTAAKYYVSQDAVEDGTTATEITATGEQKIVLAAAGTWYIVPSKTSAVKITNIAFAAPRKITFDSDGGSAVADIYVADGEAATEPAEPTKTSWDFDGWYNGADLYDWSAAVTADLALTAHWKVPDPKYSITYDINGGEGAAPTETDKAAGKVFALADAPSLTDYNFAGWLCNIDDVTYAAGDSYTMTAAATTFTAQWVPQDCKIYSLTGAIGNAEAYADNSNVEISAEILRLKSSNARIRINPSAYETFKAGDVVSISGTVGNTSKKFGVIIYAENGSTKIGEIAVAGSTAILQGSATLSADAEYLLLKREDGTTETFYTFEVSRSCAAGTAADFAYAEGTVTKKLHDPAFINPLTNDNGLAVIYHSSNLDVAKVDALTGQVEMKGAGTATITAYAGPQTKAGVLYEAGSATYSITVKGPDYTRSVSNNIGTLCVDHNVPSDGALGATFYQIAGKNEVGKLVFDEVTVLKAGEPYVFQSTTGEIALYYGETSVADPVQVNGMVGVFSDTEVEITEENKSNIMYIAQNTLWTCNNYMTFTNQKLQVAANRAYIYDYSAIEAPSSSPAPGRRRITLGVNGEQVATGIDNLNASEKPVKLLIDGQLFIIRGEQMFDATGRLVK
ncbi:MAG: InlB B-repeat-containing protein [Paludibacteraceae bacterium]|nr:InlB B-repeat-containing protein [Paludibacteraceae bacterium]